MKIPIRDEQGATLDEIELTGTEEMVLMSGMSEDSAAVWKALFRKIWRAGAVAGQAGRGLTTAAATELAPSESCLRIRPESRKWNSKTGVLNDLDFEADTAWLVLASTEGYVLEIQSKPGEWPKQTADRFLKGSDAEIHAAGELLIREEIARLKGPKAVE